MQGRSLWSYEGQVTAVHCWSVHHRQEVVLWAGLFQVNANFILYPTENSVLVHYTDLPGNVMDIHWENHTKHTIALCEQNAHFLNVPAVEFVVRIELLKGNIAGVPLLTLLIDSSHFRQASWRVPLLLLIVLLGLRFSCIAVWLREQRGVRRSSATLLLYLFASNFVQFFDPSKRYTTLPSAALPSAFVYFVSSRYLDSSLKS